MALKHYKVRAEIVRKTTDPFFNPKKHGSQTITYYNCFFDINNLIPRIEDMPIKPANPRDHENLPKNKSVMKDIREEYFSESSEFHLKNSGIIINVKYVDELNDNVLNIVVDEDELKRHGILNGGTTFTVLSRAIKELKEKGLDLPRNQYVKVELRVGVDPKTIPSISEGLNTHASVTQTSLLELDNKFDFIKNVLDHLKWGKKVSYRQYGDGEIEVTRLLQLMTMFNVNHYIHGSDKHPNKAYSSKASVVKSFMSREEDYHALANILPDIVRLMDHLRLNAHTNEVLKNRRSSNYVKAARNDQEFKLITQDIIISHDVADAFLFPVLAAFRVFVGANEGQDITWRIPFSDVLSFATQVSEKMFSKMDRIYKELNDVNALGKVSSTWETMYNLLEREFYRSESKIKKIA
jgi:hypothetical protein